MKRWQEVECRLDSDSFEAQREIRRFKAGIQKIDTINDTEEEHENPEEFRSGYTSSSRYHSDRTENEKIANGAIPDLDENIRKQLEVRLARRKTRTDAIAQDNTAQLEKEKKLAAEKKARREQAEKQRAKFEADEQVKLKKAAEEATRAEAAREKATKDKQLKEEQARSALHEKIVLKARLKEDIAPEERLAKARRFWETMPHEYKLADGHTNCNDHSGDNDLFEQMSSQRRKNDGSSSWAEQSRSRFLNDHGVVPGTRCERIAFFRLPGRR
ncbi:hypothetical protein DL98DRAFT_591869 [Cadophora sp. DSE1049]|nr:hypothetical protein DL98DRAFT_591869 [Cadophora sp. DSE1049]